MILSLRKLSAIFGPVHCRTDRRRHFLSNVQCFNHRESKGMEKAGCKGRALKIGGLAWRRQCAMVKYRCGQRGMVPFRSGKSGTAIEHACAERDIIFPEKLREIGPTDCGQRLELEYS